MSDPRFEYFNSSLDSVENRKVVELVSTMIIEQVRAKEAEMTPYVFDALMDRASRGEVVRAGGETDLGLGGGELLLYVVVPLVANTLTAYFTARYVAGVRGLDAVDDQALQISANDIQQYAKRSGVRLKRGEDMRIAAEINLQLSIKIRNVRAESRPMSIDQQQLRVLIKDAFNVAEIRTLCFDLHEPHEDILSEIEPEINAMHLIEHFRRRGRLHDLLEKLRIERPYIDWDGVIR